MKTQFAILAIAVAYISGAPTEPKVKGVDLKYAVNRTVCPFIVDVDVDEHRVPRAIKTVVCAPGRTRHCCHTHGTSRSACTQLRDDVLVHYPSGNPGAGDAKYVRLTFPVGCVCMLKDYAEGNTTPDPSLPG